MTNLFISEHFPTLLKKFQLKKVNFLYYGLDENNIKILIITMKLLSNWMYVHDLCKYRLDINIDF